MKKVMLLLLALTMFSGCAPKRGTIHALAELPQATSAQITIIRNYNPIGSTVRYYPTVNGKKVAGLYTKEHTSFQLAAGKYSIGLMFPIIGLDTWWRDELEMKFEAKKHYYFLLSPKFELISLPGVEIEEIEYEDASQRVKSSTLVPTGTVSQNPGIPAKIISAPSKAIGFGEDEGNKK